ncbi:MAG: hypothetical protein HY080_07080 [Gammaproteobacteria bacterium]|nr:hypothetical protein [Gammaproteobacteria bacterium]
MENTFYKIVAAIFMGLMILFLWPRVKFAMQNSPKGERKDWQTFALLIAGVVLFVVLLITVR